MSVRLASQPALARHPRRHVAAQWYDDSGSFPADIAIDSLSDPRDLRQVRYVGQRSAPRRRFLSDWIRELYRDELRLPVMVITAWVTSASEVWVVERERIFEYLERRLQHRPKFVD